MLKFAGSLISTSQRNPNKLKFGERRANLLHLIQKTVLWNPTLNQRREITPIKWILLRTISRLHSLRKPNATGGSANAPFPLARWFNCQPLLVKHNLQNQHSDQRDVEIHPLRSDNVPTADHESYFAPPLSIFYQTCDVVTWGWLIQFRLSVNNSMSNSVHRNSAKLLL
jgi:hypothetical protein